MTRSSMLRRTLAAALAGATLAAPTALARPIDTPRSSATAGTGQDLRSPDARDAARLPGPPTWPAHPQPITPPRPAADTGSSGPAVGLEIALGLLCVSGAAGVAVRARRRTSRSGAVA